MTPDNKPVAPGQVEAAQALIDAIGQNLGSLPDEICERTDILRAALSQPVPSAPEPSHDKPIAWWSGGEYGGGDEHGRLSLGTFTEHEDTRHDIPVYAGWNNEGKPSRNAPDNAPVPAAAPAVEPVAWVARSSLNWLIEHPAGEAATALFGPKDDRPNFAKLVPLYAAPPEPAAQGAAKPVHTDHPFQHWDRTCPACVLEASPPVPNSATQGAAEPVKYTRDFGDYATEDVMAWIDAELARCDAPMGEGLPYIPADKDVGDALRWLRANLFGISAASPAPEPLTPAAGVSEWQPIETAPKDAACVLLHIPTRHNKWTPALCATGFWYANGWLLPNADEAMQRVDPTHWMPLPALPTEKQGD